MRLDFDVSAVRTAGGTRDPGAGLAAAGSAAPAADAGKSRQPVEPVLDALAADEGDERGPEKIRVPTARGGECECGYEREGGNGGQCQNLASGFRLDGRERSGGERCGWEQCERWEGYACQSVGRSL